MSRNVLITCPICGKNREVQRGRKYCSRKCMGAATRGKPRPHNETWKKNRLEAVQKANAKRVYKKVGPRPPGVIEKMQAGLKEWEKKNPGKKQQLAMANLPKTLSGDKNANWRGGKTQEIKNFHVREGAKLRRWRKSVLERDGHACKECGSTGKLDVHHILALSKTKSFAFSRLNGVSLCRPCHSKTDSYGGHAKKHKELGRFTYIQTIPHSWQDYDTAGNYEFSEDGSLLILVSDMGDWRFEFLVAIHEFAEANLCKARGITDGEITAFDVAFEDARKPGDLSEPGDDRAAPYGNEHCVATAVERLMCAALGISWQDYEQACQRMSK